MAEPITNYPRETYTASGGAAYYQVHEHHIWLVDTLTPASRVQDAYLKHTHLIAAGRNYHEHPWGHSMVTRPPEWPL